MTIILETKVKTNVEILEIFMIYVLKQSEKLDFVKNEGLN